MNEKNAHDEHKDMPDARRDDKPPSRQRQRASDLKKDRSPRQTHTEGNAMRFKEMAEPANIDGMQQPIDGVGCENEGYHNPDDIEAASRIMRWTAEPISIHKVSRKRPSLHAGESGELQRSL
jgi:hypothetical protein